MTARTAIQMYSTICLLLTLLIGCSRGKLDISPQHFSQCEGLSTSVHVRWNISENDRPGAKIYISDVNHQPRIWKVVNPSGEADTEKAIYDGTTFTLRDAQGVLLARRTVTAESCSK